MFFRVPWYSASSSLFLAIDSERSSRLSFCACETAALFFSALESALYSAVSACVLVFNSSIWAVYIFFWALASRMVPIRSLYAAASAWAVWLPDVVLLLLGVAVGVAGVATLAADSAACCCILAILRIAWSTRVSRSLIWRFITLNPLDLDGNFSSNSYKRSSDLRKLFIFAVSVVILNDSALITII